jgi:hypothetical protein
MIGFKYSMSRGYDRGFKFSAENAVQMMKLTSVSNRRSDLYWELDKCVNCFFADAIKPQLIKSADSCFVQAEFDYTQSLHVANRLLQNYITSELEKYSDLKKSFLATMRKVSYFRLRTKFESFYSFRNLIDYISLETYCVLKDLDKSDFLNVKDYYTLHRDEEERELDEILNSRSVQDTIDYIESIFNTTGPIPEEYYGPDDENLLH